MHSRQYAVIFGFTILCLCLVAALSIPGDSDADLDTKAIVKLYSGGTLVGEWKAAGQGQMDQNGFVFPVKDGVRNLRVIIKGTFSVETIQ